MEHQTTTSAEAATNSSGPAIIHYWGRRGGGSQFSLYLAQHLKSTGTAEVVLSLSRGNEDIALFRANGLPIITFDRPGLSTLWKAAWFLPHRLMKHADALASLKPAAIIMTMNSPFAWPFIHMLQKRGLKVAYVAHDAEPHPGDYAILWQRVTQDILLKSADRVVALSNSVAKRLAARLPSVAGKISLIPLETVYPTERPRHPTLGAKEEPLRFLFFGRLLPYKGLDLLAQALETLRGDHRWQLTIAGSGPLEGDVTKLFGDWPQVDLELGWISTKRAAELFSTHHLLLCPYVEASQSGVLAEALGWALPSLVMPAGALPEQIGFGKAGLVADSMQAEGLGRALQSVLTQPDCLQRLSQGAAELLAERQRHPGWSDLIALTAGSPEETPRSSSI